MGRKRKAPPKPKQPLRGGIGDVALTPDEAMARRMERLSVNRPTTGEALRRRMLVKDLDSRQQIADALLAAARQHQNVPDEATRMYGRAFQTLPESSRSQLLEVLGSDMDRSLVREAFADFVDAEPSAAPAARAADMPDIERVPVVDVDERLPPDTGGKTYVPLSRGEEVTLSEGADWTNNQRARGWRRVLFTPERPGSPPRQVLEMLADRANEFTTEPPPKTGQANPDFGKTRDVIRRREPSIGPTVERLSPSNFEALSTDAQRAAARMSDMEDFLRETLEYQPDFLETENGKRFQSEYSKIANAHPEAVAFVNSPELTTRAMPPLGELAPVDAGRSSLPKNMQLGYIIGGEQGNYRIENRPDRRLRPGTIYEGIPPDAPNRRAWMQLAEAEDQTRRGRPTQVYLPPSDEVKGTNRPPPDTDLPERMREKRQSLTVDDAAQAVDDVADVSDEYQQIIARIEAAEAASEPATPVFDMSQDPSLFKYAPTVEAEPLAGSATGSPSKVKSDRDFALREGRPAIEKLREKVFRIANEYVDVGDVVAGPDGGLAAFDGGTSGRGSAGISGLDEDAAMARVAQVLGMDDAAPKRASGRPAIRTAGPVDARQPAPLPLDMLVPVWRGNMYFRDGGNIVIRRPNATEVAGFILDRLDMPDAGMAGRLEGVVQASMDALEPTKPQQGSRAARAAGTVFEPSDRYMADMTRDAQQQRIPGDSRPLIDTDSERAAREYAARFSPDAEWTPETQALPDNPADIPPAAPDTNTEVDNLFARFERKTPNNTLQGLLALVAGAGAASASGAENDLPPVEYLAMARKPGTSRRTRTPKTNPPPETNPPQNLPPRRRGGGSGGGGSPPPPPPPPDPPDPPKRTWDEYFAPDPIYSAARMVGGGAAGSVGRVAPTLAAGAAAAPFVLPPIIQKYREMFGDVPAAPPPSEDLDAEMRRIFAPQPEEMPMPPQMPQQYPQPNQGSSNNIQMLQQMLNAGRIS